MKNRRKIVAKTFQTPTFWVVYVLSCIGMLLIARFFYSRAFPIIQLPITTNRSSILNQAQQLATQHSWGPKKYHQAIRFELDQETQTFIELTQGGSAAFQNILEQGLYSPYTWQVRHFAEGETAETLLVFTPTGQFYGFSQKIKETDPGAALTRQKALLLAERIAMQEWNVDLKPFQLIETSQETRLSHRIDHFFVYERKQEHLGEGKYRLSMTLSGDQLSAISYWIKVPDAFLRQYAEMRSANETLATLAHALIVLVYILIGCGLGIFFLMRERWLIWKTPLWIAGIVAFLQVLEKWNQLPLSWMEYDTALPISQFLGKKLLYSGAMFLQDFLILAVSLMAAEGLSRKAFPQHVPFWNYLKPQFASSYEFLGQTVGGYLSIGIFYAYVVMVYFVGTRFLGWWSPSDLFFQPNTLSSYCPWFTSITLSLHAGLWEEALFRALPLAGAALLGKWFGRKNLWLGCAMIGQALIFGAAHANYAAQPSYARVIELMIPSLFFGALYLRFGLLPGVLLHFIFDVISFAIPIFTSAAPLIWLDRIGIILLALAPLGWCGMAWLRTGRWRWLQPHELNRRWAPTLTPQELTLQTATDPVAWIPTPSLSLSRTHTKWVYLIIVCGLFVWILLLRSLKPFPTLDLTREQAIEIAKKKVDLELKSTSKKEDSKWTIVSQVVTRREQDTDALIWRTAGAKKYRELLGTYLSTPSWLIRWVRFQGDVANRAEEYQVSVSHRGQTHIRHILPEEQPGASLSEQAAQQLAFDHLVKRYQLSKTAVKKVSSTELKRPHRRDWLFVFSNPAVVLPQGEARIAILIGGEHVITSEAWIFPPEEWTRHERHEIEQAHSVQVLSYLLKALFYVSGFIYAIIAWTRKEFHFRAFRYSLFFLGSIELVCWLNQLPAYIGRLSTTQPLWHQALNLIGSTAIQFIPWIFSMSVGVGGILALIQKQQKQKTLSSAAQKQDILLGALLGMGAAVLIEVIAHHILPRPAPLWGSLSALEHWTPLGSAFRSIPHFLITTLLGCGLGWWVQRLTQNWQQRILLGQILLFCTGLTFVGLDGPTPLRWFVMGMSIGLYCYLALRYVIRSELKLIPLAVGVFFGLLESKQMALHPFTGSTAYSIMTILLELFFAWVSYRLILRQGSM